MASKQFTVGTVIAIDLQDGSGFTVGTITRQTWAYTLDGQELPIFDIQPAAGQAMDIPFSVALGDLYRFGVALPTRVLVDDGRIVAAN